jgi:hypothetical protein
VVHELHADNAITIGQARRLAAALTVTAPMALAAA